MGTLTANASASLSATGNTTATGSITWTPPSLPAGDSSWTSIVISGSWTWNGKGTINSVTIGGTNTSDSAAFSIQLGTSAASPLSITCRGDNKNATGNNFAWSNLIVTYTYSLYFNVSSIAATNGTFTLSQSGWLEEGTSVTITAVPNKGYEVEGYYVNGAKIDGNSFIPTSDSVVSVVFREIQVRIYAKTESTWTWYNEVYKKIDGTWQLQNDLTASLDPDVKYVRK